MMHISHQPAARVQPSVLGALIIIVLRCLREAGIELPGGIRAALVAVGASRTHAYDLVARVEAALVELMGSPGRPPKAPPKSSEGEGELSQSLLAWVMASPGAVVTNEHRRAYDISFRHKVLELRQAYEGMELAQFAHATCVPVETLRTWLKPPSDETEEPQENASGTEPDEPPEGDASPRLVRIRLAQLESLMAAWSSWKGQFKTFCEHARTELHLPFGDTAIGKTLDFLGARRRRRRAGRSPNELALRGAFLKFFPGALWTADGSPILVAVDGQPFAFNLELVVDTACAAVVGWSLRDEEDTQAVLDAYHDAVRATGHDPLGLLLDNRSCNHTDAVREALDDTLLIHATIGRPQNKAHVEGAFGLFSQTTPPLVIHTRDPKTCAAELLGLVVQTWARTLNHRPARNGGPSRAQRYAGAQPTSEELEQAHRALLERQRRQRKANETRTARQNPIVRRMLDETFERLGLEDETGNIRSAIARHPLDHILAAIAIYEAKRQIGTLPEGAAGRYLLGIVRNLVHRDEGLTTLDHLIDLRTRAGDLVMQQLERRHQALAEAHPDLGDLGDRLADAATTAPTRLEHRYWLHALADALAGAPNPEQRLRRVALRVHTHFQEPKTRRHDLVRHLTNLVIPL